MLIADISINKVRYIDEIFIQRISGRLHEKCEYKIRNPKGYDTKIFTHNYDDGYFPLLCRVLNYLNDNGYK